MKKPEETKPQSSMERLASFTKKLIAVPREEVAKKEREYKRARANAKRKPRHG